MAAATAAEKEPGGTPVSVDHLAHSHQNVTIMFMDIVGEGMEAGIGGRNWEGRQGGERSPEVPAPSLFIIRPSSSGFTTMSKEVLPAEVGGFICMPAVMDCVPDTGIHMVEHSGLTMCASAEEILRELE